MSFNHNQSSHSSIRNVENHQFMNFLGLTPMTRPVITNLLMKKSNNHSHTEQFYSFCKVKGCKNANTHTTMGHRCSKCNNYGHGRDVCGTYQSNHLYNHFKDIIPSNQQCTISGCTHKTLHTTAGHYCNKCNIYGQHNCFALFQTIDNCSCPQCKPEKRKTYTTNQLTTMQISMCNGCYAEKCDGFVITNHEQSCIFFKKSNNQYCVDCSINAAKFGMHHIDDFWKIKMNSLSHISNFILRNIMMRRKLLKISAEQKVYIILHTDIGNIIYCRQQKEDFPVENYIALKDENDPIAEIFIADYMILMRFI